MADVISITQGLPPVVPPDSLHAQIAERLIGQTEAVDNIVPFIEMHQAGLAPEGRPLGVVLLLGPTGTGKTHTVETVAEVLHGNKKNILKVDCGEFQMEHEVAKLIGAPPGYLGHKETTPLLNQAKLQQVTSEKSDISVVLFDEIEKAAGSLTRLLLGILDKATLRLGDNATVNFERSLIFLTSNLGARAIEDLAKGFGLAGAVPPSKVAQKKREDVSLAAVRQKFSPEFINRIDAMVTYRPLERAECEAILDAQLFEFTKLVQTRLGLRAFRLMVRTAARQLLLDKGVSAQYGARELKRTVQNHLVKPIGAMVCRGEVPPQSTVVLDARSGKFSLRVDSAQCA